MNSKLVQQIRQNFEAKSTEELLKTWEENDKEQYSEEAFEAVKQLLLERDITIPPQKIRVESVKATLNQICPLCRKEKHMGKKAKPLYGHLVCKICHHAFESRRQLAYAVDIILYWVCFGILLYVTPLGELSEDTMPLLVFLLSLIFILKDGFSGSSPGKAIMGLQVADKTTGQPIGFMTSFKRNLPLIIPPMVFIVAFQLHKGNRIGDGWANTRVIWKKYRDKVPFTTEEVNHSPA